MSLEIRNSVVNFCQKWSHKTTFPINYFIKKIKLPSSKYYSWVKRYGRANEHNFKTPRSFYVLQWEIDAVIEFSKLHPKEGCRYLSYMMLDEGIVAISPSTTYRILLKAGELEKKKKVESLKGTGFIQPKYAHKDWHIDVSYINVAGTFYYLCSVLDGYSRSILGWVLKSSMSEKEICILLQSVKEKYPSATPNIISDNGPQFISNNFKTFVRESSMNHIRTSPYYPQSNGKIERWHKSLKTESIRPFSPVDYEDAMRIITNYISFYNTKRLHSAIGYLTPETKLNGSGDEIQKERKLKLKIAKEKRREQQQINNSILKTN